MAIVLIQGWEAGPVPPVNGSLPQTGTSQPAEIFTGRDGIGRSLSRSNVFDVSWRESFVSGTDQIYLHLGYYFAPGGRQYSFFFIHTDGGVTTQINVSPDASTRKVVLARGGTIIQTSTLTLNSAGTWYSVEASVLIHPSAGSIVVKVDGVEFINFVGNTKAGGTSNRPDTITVQAGENGFYRVDDMVIADASGSVNNTWLGGLSVVGSMPSGNGASSSLVGSDGNSVNNYQQVDEYPFSTTDYNGSAVTGDRDTYDLTPVNKLGKVLAVQSVAYASKSDAASKSFKHVMRSSGGTVVTSSAQALTTSWLILPGPVWETDATGASWVTAAQVDAHEFGFEVG